MGFNHRQGAPAAFVVEPNNLKEEEDGGGSIGRKFYLEQKALVDFHERQQLTQQPSSRQSQVPDTTSGGGGVVVVVVVKVGPFAHFKNISSPPRRRRLYSRLHRDGNDMGILSVLDSLEVSVSGPPTTPEIEPLHPTTNVSFSSAPPGRPRPLRIIHHHCHRDFAQCAPREFVT